MNQNRSVDSNSILEIPIVDELSGESLTQSALRGFGWNLAGSVVRHGAGFLINIILARLLGPEPFGIVAIATIVISIGNLIVDSGLNASLVQKNELTEGDIKYVFTIQMVLGISIYLLIVLLTPLLSRWFAETEIIPVLRVLSLMIVLQAASQTSMGLLKRNLKFKQIQQAVLVSYLVGYLLLGLPLAFAEKGVWSLVFAQLTQSFIYLIMVYWNVRHPIAFSFHDENKITRFGINILGANIANWIIASIDSTLLGKRFGLEVLGLYNRSMTLAFTPVNIIVFTSQSIIFSASSRAQESEIKVKKAFLGVFSTFIFILFPSSIILSLLAEPTITVIYGLKWIGATPFLRILALALPFYALMAICGPTLAGMGKPDVELRIQWLIAVVYIIAILIAIQFSSEIVLWTILGMFVIRFVLLSSATFRIFHISLKDLSTVIIITLVMTFLVSAVVILSGFLLSQKGATTRLFFQSLAAFLSWILLVVLFKEKIVDTELFLIANKLHDFFIPM